ncbi:hypothetical protein J6590_051160 [Homalodisca vitripennis]|nr:hypothetical protein J6590_051160 [Homalodisca vitripennis]
MRNSIAYSPTAVLGVRVWDGRAMAKTGTLRATRTAAHLQSTTGTKLWSRSSSRATHRPPACALNFPHHGRFPSPFRFLPGPYHCSLGPSHGMPRRGEGEHGRDLRGGGKGISRANSLPLASETVMTMFIPTADSNDNVYSNSRQQCQCLFQQQTAMTMFIPTADSYDNVYTNGRQQ